MLEQSSLLDIYRHLVWDVEECLAMTKGTLGGSFEKIAQSSASRGFERIFLLRLPEICNDFEKSLETGTFVVSRGEFTKGEYLSIYTELSSRIFDDSRILRDDACTESIRHMRQLLRCFKRLNVPCPPESSKEKILEFKQIEVELPTPTYSWGCVSLSFNGIYPHLNDVDAIRHVREAEHPQLGGSSEIVREDLDSIQFVADKISRSFFVELDKLRPKHGPGSVSEKWESSKFEFPTWPERLDHFFPYIDYGVYNPIAYEMDEVRPDAAAKLVGVPKDYKGPRLIASEPISSQYIQQGILRELRKRLKKSPVRFSYDPLSQEPSRSLVLSSSVDKSLSTIDLSSASDRMSCWLVERIFRRNYVLLQQLNAARTPSITIDGEELVQKKFAAQGAAFTFPIQSIVYAVICAGVIYSSNKSMRISDCFRKVRVFGDDIIIPSEYFERVCLCLEALFLKVNHKKSFSYGYFRESCGMDAYKGHNVTPVSIHETFKPKDPVTLVSVVEISNNLYLKGYVRTSARLQESIPRKLLRQLPFVGPDVTVFGLRGSGLNQLPSRWNSHWQFHETLCLTVESKVKRSSPKPNHRLHQWFCEEPSPLVRWEPGEVLDSPSCYRRVWVPNFLLGR